MAAARYLVALFLGLLVAAVPSIGPVGGPETEPARSLRFHSERVRLTVRSDTLEVDGFYRFLPTGRNEAMTLLFPYPRDSLFGEPRTLLLETIGPGGAVHRLPVRELPEGRGVRWDLPPARVDTLGVHTIYVQALRACIARYLVTTALPWGEPLASARFEILLPPGASAPTFSHPFRPESIEGDTVWVYEERPFLPESEIEVRWNDPERCRRKPQPDAKP